VGFSDIFKRLKEQQGPAGPAEAPQATAPAAPQQQTPQWGGFNSENVWDNLGDLNPVAAQYGMQRDDLSTQRDAFLQPWEQKYRDARAAQGQKVDATSANVYGDAGFQNFVRSGGQLGYQPPQSIDGGSGSGGVQTQQLAPGQVDPRRQQLYDILMQRINRSEAVDRNDPIIRAQSDANIANEERNRRSYVNDAAERGGPLANIQGERRLAAERAGQRTGTFEAALLGQELAARRQQAAQALAQAGGQLSQDQQVDLQERLANLDAAIKGQSMVLQDKGLSQDWQKSLLQNDQFLRQLGLSEWDKTNYWDALRSGLIDG
jgi:hypothetical protein